MKSKLIVRIVCIILAVLLVGSVFAMIIPYIAHAAGMEGYISDDYVNLRSGAGTGYSVVACLREDTKVTFESTETYNSDWYKVTEQGSGDRLCSQELCQPDRGFLRFLRKLRLDGLYQRRLRQPPLRRRHR